MKLKIRSDKIKGIERILKNENIYNFDIFFGKMFRTGFVPFLNHWDFKCIKNSLESNYTSISINIGKRIYNEIYNMGFITDRDIIIGKVLEEKNEHISALVYHIGDYDIILIQNEKEYGLEVKFIKKPSKINDLFEPIKYLYRIIKKKVVEVEESESIIKEYNRIFNKKEEYPWIVPQGLRFIEEKNLLNIKDYLVFPMYRGEKYTLYLSINGIYLISKIKILKVENENINDNRELHNTVITGKWYENSFTGYDISYIGGKDIRNKRLSRRMKYLAIVSDKFNFCRITTYYSNDISKHTQELLNDYEGVLFAPNYANYTNDRIFLYQPVENVGINLKIEKKIESNFQTFILKITDNKLFCGTTDFPYQTCIPLSKEDRKFIDGLEDIIIYEFRWRNDGLVPYTRKSETSSNMIAEKSWNFINNTLSKKLLINSLNNI